MINNLHPQFKLNSHQFKTADELISFSKLIDVDAFYFLNDWFDKSPHIKVLTSGSTGFPKEIILKKEHMINSAIATGKFFDLPENTTALLCLSSKYIAGKMMLVRAMVLGWDIEVVDPTSNPLKNIHKKFDFCAMVPLQVASSLKEIHKISVLIVGGAAVSNSLKKSIQNIKTNVFATYGMTETITHIAVQKLNNNPTTYFECLPKVTVLIDYRSCLVIDAPNITNHRIITNDIVELIDENLFIWKGRFDNVINSGGVKLFPEQIEKELEDIIQTRFFIASEKDELLGNKVILVIESMPFCADDLMNLQHKLKTTLSAFKVPKSIYFTPQFFETVSQKIQRKKTLDFILNQPKN